MRKCNFEREREAGEREIETKKESRRDYKRKEKESKKWIRKFFNIFNYRNVFFRIVSLSLTI